MCFNLLLTQKKVLNYYLHAVYEVWNSKPKAKKGNVPWAAFAKAVNELCHNVERKREGKDCKDKMRNIQKKPKDLAQKVRARRAVDPGATQLVTEELLAILKAKNWKGNVTEEVQKG